MTQMQRRSHPGARTRCVRDGMYVGQCRGTAVESDSLVSRTGKQLPRAVQQDDAVCKCGHRTCTIGGGVHMYHKILLLADGGSVVCVCVWLYDVRSKDMVGKKVKNDTENFHEILSSCK